MRGLVFLVAACCVNVAAAQEASPVERLLAGDESERARALSELEALGAEANDELGTAWRELAQGFTRETSFGMRRLIEAFERMGEDALGALPQIQAGLCDIPFAPWKNDWDMWHDRALAARERASRSLQADIDGWVGGIGQAAIAPYLRSFVGLSCSRAVPDLAHFRVRRRDRVPLLIELYKEPELRGQVTRWAHDLGLEEHRALIEHLGRAPVEDLVPALALVHAMPKRKDALAEATVRLLDHDDATIRSSAIETLFRMNAQLGTFLPLLEHDDAAVRRRVAEELSRTPSRRGRTAYLVRNGLAALADALDDPDENVRIFAVRTLHDLVRRQNPRRAAGSEHGYAIEMLRGVRPELRAFESAFETATGDASPLVAFWAESALKDLGRGRWMRLETLLRQDDLFTLYDGERKEWTLPQLLTELDVAGSVDWPEDSCRWPLADTDYRWEATLAIVRTHLPNLIRDEREDVLVQLENELDARAELLCRFADECGWLMRDESGLFEEMAMLGWVRNSDFGGKVTLDRSAKLRCLTRGWAAEPLASVIAGLDSYDGVRAEALAELTDWGAEALPALPFIVRQWRAEDPGDRARTIALIRAMGEPARSYLERARTHDSENVRAEVQRVLAALER